MSPSHYISALVSLMVTCVITVGCTPRPISSSATELSGEASVTNRGNSVIPGIVRDAEPAVMGVIDDSPARGGGAVLSSGLYRLGTAVLFQKDAHYGYLVTNQFWVHPSRGVEVVLPSGRHIKANIAGVAPDTNIAVLTIPVTLVRNTQAIRFADSDRLQAGESAVAMGIAMSDDFALAVTSGVISSPSRKMPISRNFAAQQTYRTFIQTDAALNPGNSGGPLLNVRGEAVGINVGKIQKPGFEGMGFAIPANTVRKAVEQILSER